MWVSRVVTKYMNYVHTGMWNDGICRVEVKTYEAVLSFVNISLLLHIILMIRNRIKVLKNIRRQFCVLIY